jgi:peptide/nickel transport system permease protein
MRNPRRFFAHWQNLLGLSIVVLYILAAIFAPMLAPPKDPENFSPFLIVDGVKSRTPLPPSEKAIFGTLATGVLLRQLDIYYTVIWGTRSALKFGLLVALSTALIGVAVGAISGFLGGWFNSLTMRVTDAFLAFPIIAGVVLFQSLIMKANPVPIDQLSLASGQQAEAISLRAIITQINPVMLALILFSWMPYARITNTMVLRLKQAEFVQAAHALGANSSHIIWRHLVPNSISPAIVLAARDIGLVVLLQATLTFIGIGGESEWGILLAVGRQWILGIGGNPLTYWWVFIPASLALAFFGIGWNLLGDGLNDLLNPRQN